MKLKYICATYALLHETRFNFLKKGQAFSPFYIANFYVSDLVEQNNGAVFHID